jgi:hypothetical protein
MESTKCWPFPPGRRTDDENCITREAIELVSFRYEFRSNRLTVSEEVRADDALWSDMHTQMSSHERTEL